MSTRTAHRGLVSPKIPLLIVGGCVALGSGLLIRNTVLREDPPRSEFPVEKNSSAMSPSVTTGKLLSPGERQGHGSPPLPPPDAYGKGDMEMLSEDLSYHDPEFLVAQLSRSADRMSTAELNQLNRDLQALTAFGSDAIPSIRDYLDQFEDTPLVSNERDAKVPYPTVRLALLEVLKQIGGPEAIALELEVLEQTTNPSEIAFLGAALEEQEPGSHLEQVLDASLEVLVLAAEEQLPGPEMAPVFRLLGSYNNDAAILALEKSIPVWRRYSMMALAETPEGNGVPAIVNQIQEGVERQDHAIEQFGWELLAQVAHTNPVARDYLLEATSLNVIPEELWSRIAMHAAGKEHYQMVKPEQTDPNIRENYTSHRFRKDSGLQGEQMIFRWRPRPDSISDQLQARSEVLDALVLAAPSSEARRALETVQKSQ